MNAEEARAVIDAVVANVAGASLKITAPPRVDSSWCASLLWPGETGWTFGYVQLGSTQAEAVERLAHSIIAGPVVLKVEEGDVGR